MPDALNPTPEEVAMAEKYVEKFVGTVLVICGEQQPETVRLAMAHAVRNTALAAIIETTERAAKLADNTGVAIGYSHHKLRQVIVSRLRSGDHLK